MTAVATVAPQSRPSAPSVTTGRATVPRARRKSRAPKVTAPNVSVSCVFCQEAISTASFAPLRSEPRRMSAQCGNCGLQVSATLATWERWGRATPEVPVRSRSETLRARRVAAATRQLRGQLAVTAPYETAG